MKVSCAVSLQHRVHCTMSGEVAHCVFVQQEPVSPMFIYDSPSVSCGHFFKVLFCCFVLCGVVSVVLLLAVIVWLNSEIFNFGGY